jgi:hypothetical protein
MESSNHKIANFISESEKKCILEFVNSLSQESKIKNVHISEVSNMMNGHSYMFDITKTEISKYLSNYQSSNNNMNIDLPIIFIDILDRISNTLIIKSDNVFLQIIDQNRGGKIIPHYDSSIIGYINYKCNISVLSENYEIFIGNNKMNICEGDLYSFESSLYKHWTNEFSNRRVLLSYGFGLKYEDLQRSPNDPRIRMSERIQKYFQQITN